MSNKISKIRENAKARQNYKKYVLYGSLAGSCIVSVGKLAGKTENELVKEFDKLKTNKEFSSCSNTLEVCDWLFDYFKVDKQYKDNLVIVYDEDEVYTPLVTLMVDDTILPLDPDGKSLGVISMIGAKDNIVWERVYEE